MYFILLPDGLSAQAVRARLAAESSTNVVSGTFNELLQALATNWLLPDIYSDFDKVLRDAARSLQGCFWSESLQTDETVTLHNLRKSLDVILGALSLADSIHALPDPDSRIERYFNDLAMLHGQMGEIRVPNQELAKLWLAEPLSDCVTDLKIAYLPEICRFDVWQQQVIERLVTGTEKDEVVGRLEKMLREIYTAPSASPEIAHMTSRLFSADLEPVSLSSFTNFIACRDALEEIQLTVAVVQNKLSQGYHYSDFAVVVPDHHHYRLWLVAEFNKAGILTSHLHSGKANFRWDQQLIKDILNYYLRATASAGSVDPMLIASLLVNPLMPWTRKRGQAAYQKIKRIGLKNATEKSEGELRNFQFMLINLPECNDIAAWLNEFSAILKFPGDKRLSSSETFLELVEACDFDRCETVDDLQRVYKQLVVKSEVLSESEGYIANGVLILTENEWLLHHVRFLYFLGFNKDHYSSGKASYGVFDTLEVADLSERTGLSLSAGDTDRSYFQAKFLKQIACADESVTFIKSLLTLDGEPASDSDSIVDLALCFQSETELKPDILWSDTYNLSESLVRYSAINIEPKEEAKPEVEQGFINLDCDLLAINVDISGALRRESPSSLEKMMVSPLAWFMSRQNIASRLWAVSEIDPALLGTVAHKCFELYLSENPGFTQTDIDQIFQRSVMAEAPLLLEANRKMDYTQLKQEVWNALLPFTEWLRVSDLKVEKLEELIEGDLFGIALKGFIDAVFSTGEGYLIIDYKKSRSENYVRRLNSGFDLQTMIYRELYTGKVESTKIVRSGYYTLNDRTLILDSQGSAFAEEVQDIGYAELKSESISGQSEKARKLIQHRLSQLRKGIIELNSETDAEFWEAAGIKTLKYLTEESPLIAAYLKPGEGI